MHDTISDLDTDWSTISHIMNDWSRDLSTYSLQDWVRCYLRSEKWNSQQLSLYVYIPLGLKFCDLNEK